MFDCVKKGMYDLLRNKLRAFLTIGGIAIGVLSVIVISTIGEIGKNSIDSQMNDMGMNSLVVSADNSFCEGLWEKDLETIKQINEIQNAMPLMNYYTKGQFLSNEFTCMAWGVNEDADEVIELIPVHGRLLNEGDIISASKVCIVDEKLAIETYKRSNVLGKEIEITINGINEKFEIVGVVRSGVSFLQNMLGAYVPNFVYMPYTTLEEGNSQHYFDQIAVKLKDSSYADTVESEIVRSIEINRETPVSINVENLLKQKSQMNSIMSIVTVILSAIAAISLIVSGLSIMTVMLVSVNERTREIGIKKSIGATNSDILSEFLLESVLITFVGGTIGILIGIVISYVGSLILSLPFCINYEMTGLVMIFSVVIGLVFGVYPAYRAAMLKPVEALRYE